ncbi:MAG TPA: DUF4965 domain-containing protein [Fimbriimonadaceae bacterium]|nr:DUF4965 domain-containing protein [Fimbriimonadaceae bacterium]
MLALTAFFALQAHPFRPPAVPLVTHDPYFSIWSKADRPYDDVTRHWTHAPNGIRVLANVDGALYPVMGPTRVKDRAAPARANGFWSSVGIRVTPTRSIYEFIGGGVELRLTWTSPLLPSDLDLLTRPVTYLSWEIRASDGKSHTVYLDYEIDAGIAGVNTTGRTAEYRDGVPLNTVRLYSRIQAPLSTPGDGTRINWGYLYAAAPGNEMRGFGVDPNGSKNSNPYGGGSWSFEHSSKPHSGHLILAYDELYEIDYFGQKLLPYWKRNGDTAERLLEKAERDYPRIVKECEAFDDRLMADLAKAGGAEYAQLCALAYRQAFAACGIAADAKGQPLMFTKENTSNGDIATVDVIFPMDPMLILLSPALAKATLVPDLDYAASDHWKFPNAPHDLGTYPIASGTDDGGEGMPVEESGNMLILCDAICQTEGSGAWVDKWWGKLTQWEQYLEKYGYDPEDQLCTDDFMGHLAHNSNLAIKAILGIAAYGDMCRLRGDAATADKLQKLAHKYAEHWMEAANDGDHTRLAFDKPNTWSQKYNLVWDRILGLHIFPPRLAAEEVAFYKSKLQSYGVPLDSRTKLTKTDWSVWSAALATGKADFESLISPIYRYMDTTTNREPMVDSYITNDIHSNGMHARPVVGGVFIQMLNDRATWMKWAKAGDAKVGPWAPFPKRPTLVDVIPSSQTSPKTWRYTLTKPAAGWEKPGFDDSGWKSAPGPFGSDGTPGINPRTQWTSDDIWLRREVTVPAVGFKNLQLLMYHDEDIEVYVNGALAGSEAGYRTTYVRQDVSPEALKLFKPGAKLMLAVHCHQTTGGQGVDVGFVDVRQPES